MNSLIELGSEKLDLEFVQESSNIWEIQDINYWSHLVSSNFYLVIILEFLYLFGTWFGQKYMKGRSPFNLKRSLVYWNGGLSIFSGVVAWKFWEEIGRIWSIYGEYAICNRVPISRGILFWGLAFLFSKVVELGDTVYLVLHGKRVIFLHWFHHSAVLFTAFFMFPKLEPIAFMCILVNSTVHTFMYFYFAMMAGGYKIPKSIGMTITSIQITQFIIGISVWIYSLKKKFAGEFCQLSYSTSILGLSQGFVYLVLFSKIFRDNYNKAKNKK